MNLLLAFIIAMATTMVLIPPLARSAGRLRVLDAPGARKVHAEPMPRVGGIAMLVGVIIALVFWLPAFNQRMLAWLAGAVIVFVFGVWDDRVQLSPMAKLLGQLLAIGCVVFLGDISLGTYTLGERHALPGWISVPVTFLFLLGATNAVNLADGLDGLAGGTTLLSCGALGLLGITYGVMPVAVTAIAITGGLLGFLRFNTYPARIFMGDGGSQFLGFAVATLALMLTQDPTVPLSTALPLMLLGLPAVDTLMVMAQRWRAGSPLFRGDRRHVHHKLLALGFDHAEAVVVIYALQTVFFVAAWVMRYETDLIIVAAFLLLALLIFVALGAGGRLGWRWRRAPSATEAASSPLRRAMAWFAAPARLPRWAIVTAGGCLLLYVMAVGLLAGRPTEDVGWLAVGLGMALVLMLLSSASLPRSDWLARIVLYIGAVMAVYLDHITLEKVATLQQIKWLCLPLLAASVIVRIRLSTERRFRVTALDVLILFAAAVIPLLPGLTGGGSNLGLSLLKLVTLVYAIELIADQVPRGQRLIAGGTGVFFIVVALRALS